jgi:hypothetical protein
MAETALPQDEVVVTSEKALFNNAIDRKVYNVEKDIMSKTGTVSELLQNIPSVQVDLDGNVSLRGSGSVLILVNGKPSSLMGKSRADVLQQMPANAIEKIEVINNLVLKKDAKRGLTADATANAGTHGRHNENLNLNVNPGKLSLHANAGFRQDERNRFGTDIREQARFPHRLPRFDLAFWKTGKEIKRKIDAI